LNPWSDLTWLSISLAKRLIPPLGPVGYERSMVEHRRPYQTADGFICVLPYNTKQWRAFFEMMERPGMIEDPRVNDGKMRSEKIGELYEMVAQCVRDWPTEPLLEAFAHSRYPPRQSDTAWRARK
jgi:crotonobetainyl-CoA:carnitine CoA-transferase CaiB-like acyl-CoA transferase